MKKFCSVLVLSAFAVACSASDPGVTTAVKSKLAADDTVSALEIDVDTADGVVTLTGYVPTQTAKDRAVQLARETDGVVRVEDRLTLDPYATVDSRIDDTTDSAAEATSGTVDSASDKAGDAADAVGDAARATGDAASAAARDAAPVLEDAGISAAV